MKNNRKQMYKMGEWLEKYLNPNANSNDFVELSQWFLNYYDVKFSISSNDFSYRTTEFVNKYIREIKQCMVDVSTYWRAIIYYEDIWLFKEGNENLADDIKNKNIPTVDKQILLALLDYQKEIEDEFDKKIKKLYFNFRSPKKTNVNNISPLEKQFQNLCRSDRKEIFELKHYLLEFKATVLYDLFEIYFYKEISLLILKHIQGKEESWDTIFAIEIQKLNKNSQGKTKQLKLPFSMQVKNHDIGVYIKDYIFPDYNDFSQKISLNKSKAVFKYSSDSFQYFSRTFKFPKNLLDEFKIPSLFPWQTAVSKIFLDFLINGGQKHIVFCKHCGRFTLSKRIKPDGNPEKIFCGAKCRTANKKK